MKQSLKTILAGLVMLCIILSAFPVMALPYTWEDGVVPDGWEVENQFDEIRATNILQPINPNASQECRNLYAYLCTLMDDPAFMVGQFDISSNNSVYNQVVREQGYEPALYSTRFLMGEVEEPQFEGPNNDILVNTPTIFINLDRANEQLINHYNNGNVLLIHADRAYREILIDFLLKKGTYSNVGGMIREMDRCNPDRDMQAYAIWVQYQDARNAALKRLEDSGVKAYLYRDLVEFNYHGFFGIEPGAPQAFVRVWQQMVQNMIDYGLTGFLATFSPGARTDQLYCNPGNDYVDVYSVTLYAEEEDKGHFKGNAFPAYDWYIKTGKPIGFSEFSCRRGDESMAAALQPRSSWFLTLQDVISYWPNVCWVNCWGDSSFSLINAEDAGAGNDDGRLFLDSPFTLNLSEIIDYKTGVIGAPGVVQLYKTSNASDKRIGLEERSYTAAQLKEQGLDLTAIRSVRVNTGYGIVFYEGDDCTGETYEYIASEKGIPANVAANFRSCEVTTLTSVSTDMYTVASDNDENSWKATDGERTSWMGYLGDDGTAWLYIDMEVPYTISRYVVKSAGYAGQLDMYNVRDFQFQTSMDGKTWVTQDTIKNNTFSQVARNIKPVSARYFRLLITGANSSNSTNEMDRKSVTISEFELYGAKTVIADTDESDVKPTDTNLPSASDTTPGSDDPDNTVPGDVITDDPGTIDEPETPDDSSNNSSPSTQKKVNKVVRVSYFPWWGWLLIAAGVLLAAGVILWLVLFLRRRSKDGQSA